MPSKPPKHTKPWPGSRPTKQPAPLARKAPVEPKAPTRHDAFAIAAPGLSALLAAECTALGFVPREVTPAGVALDLDHRQLFALNAQTRVASRVLVRLAQFTARDFATLEKQAARLVWRQVLSAGADVRLRVTCRKSRLYHSDAVAERVARGITGQIKDARVSTKANPDEDDDAIGPTIARDGELAQLIVVRIEHDVCTISADSSGELLHKRGWRQAVAKAPLRETLAAAMLMRCAWDGTCALVDPFCGSGTIGIEGALMARRIAPGLSRAFAMEQWPAADRALFASVRDALRAAVLPNVGVPIVMRDRDAGAIDAARANAERAGVGGDVVITQGPLSETALAAIATQGLVLTNPPYGLRVSDGVDLRGLFARLGDVLYAGGEGWQLGLLMPADRALLGQLPRPVASLLRTSNGGIAVELLRTV